MMHAPCANKCNFMSSNFLSTDQLVKYMKIYATTKISMYIIYMAHSGQLRNDKLFEFCRYLLVIVTAGSDRMPGLSQDPFTT